MASRRRGRRTATAAATTFRTLAGPFKVNAAFRKGRTESVAEARREAAANSSEVLLEIRGRSDRGSFRSGVNSAPELCFLANSNSGIGIGIELA